MLLSFDFANPLYISQDNLIDTVKISFRNTNLYMFPADEEKAAIPDGYTITFELPLQLAKGKSTAQTILQTEEPVKGFIGANLFISFCFNISMNILYAMINSLQITAHLPLNNISFTSNAMETFQYLIDIVSFDFFEVKDHVAFGFTQTDAWTYRFALLDYESFNFIENLGSISLFLVVYILWIVVSLALKFTKIEFNKSPWLQRRVGKIYIVQSLFRFFLETYFELLICSVLFIGMLRTTEEVTKRVISALCLKMRRNAMQWTKAMLLIWSMTRKLTVQIRILLIQLTKMAQLQQVYQKLQKTTVFTVKMISIDCQGSISTHG